VNDPRPISESEFTKRVTPAVRLFLSVDLENSTRLKHSPTSKGEEWLTAVILFARQFPQLLDAQLQEHARLSGHPPPTLPPIWKMLGDELIFVTVIDRATQAAVYIESFQSALRIWNQDVTNEAVTNGSSRGKLRVKGAAWLAGFPIVNVVLDAGDGREDYAGPSLDAGFRIARLATPRKLAISVDLAWLLLKSNFKSDANGLILFSGPAHLKGLAEESGYPFLWIEVGVSKYLESERKLLGYGGQTDKDAMLALCEHFIHEFGVPRHLPFLADDPEFSAKPPNYDDDLIVRTEFLRQNVYVVDEPDQIQPEVPRSDLSKDQLLSQLDALDARPNP
jgi:hypothetical protein